MFASFVTTVGHPVILDLASKVLDRRFLLLGLVTQLESVLVRSSIWCISSYSPLFPL